MKNNVPRLLSSLYNTPTLSTQSLLEEVTDYLKSRLSGPDILVDGSREATKEAKELVSVENGFAFLNIEGPLSYRYSWIQAICGLTSYQKLKADVQQAIELGAHTIVFDTDSGGGQAYACFETANSIKQMCKEAGVKTLAYVDGSACSGAYALVSICDEIIANPMAEVGSVGVVMQLRNNLPALAKEGTEIKFVYSGKEKIPYDKDLKFKKEFIQSLQEGTDALYKEFTSFVAEQREMSVEAVENTEAQVYRASQALEIGFIDKIMTHDEFFNYLSSEEVNGGQMPLVKNPMNFFREKLSKDEDTSSTELEADDQGEKPKMSEPKLDLSSPEVQELIQSTVAEKMAAVEAEKALALEEATKAKEALAAIEKEKIAQIEKEFSTSLEKFSFVQEDQKTILVQSLMSMDAETRTTWMSALEAASGAIEASVTTETLGVQGQEQLDIAPEEKSKKNVSKFITNKKRA